MAEEAMSGSGHKCKFRNHGIKLVSKSRPLDGIRLACRSSRQEQIRTDFIIGESEKQLSRQYHFKVEGAGDGLKLKIIMPIFRCPKETEEIVIKTYGKQELKVLKLKQGSKKGWFCIFRHKLTSGTSLVAVCRSRQARTFDSPDPPRRLSFISDMRQAIRESSSRSSRDLTHWSSMTVHVYGNKPFYSILGEYLLFSGVIQEEFLNDNLLACILGKIKDMWAAVLILIGVPFNFIETKMKKMKDVNTNDNIRFKLFRQWRDGNSHKEDKGIPELLSSVIKCGKLSCCNYIRRCLKLWREQLFSADVRFVSWIERAYADSNMFMPTIYPRPMSDQYLVLLCERLKPTPDLAHALNISHQEYKSIIQSQFYIDDMMKLLKIFMIFRERQEDLADALQYLLDCLYNLGYKDQWSRGVACINGWLNRHAEVTDSLRNPIEKLLARIKSNKRSPRLLLKRWNTAHVGVFRGLSFSRQRSATASQSNSRLRTSTLKPHRSLYSFAP